MAMTLKENVYKAINTLRLLWMVGLAIFGPPYGLPQTRK